MTNTPTKQYRFIRHCVIILFILSGSLLPVSGMAQKLYENQDNIITIKIPGIDTSKLEVTTKDGTIIRKGTDQWIVCPNSKKDENGERKDFIITVSTNRNGKNEVLASKAYKVTKIHTIDYYDKATHHLKIDEFAKGDELKLKIDRIKVKNITIHSYLHDISEQFEADFNEYTRFGLLHINDITYHGWSLKYYFFLISKEKKPFTKVMFDKAWNASGKRIDLPPIELTFE